jgi:hypothetical protein
MVVPKVHQLSTPRRELRCMISPTSLSAFSPSPAAAEPVAAARRLAPVSGQPDPRQSRSASPVPRPGGAPLPRGSLLDRLA